MVPVLVESCLEQGGMANFNHVAKIHGSPVGDRGGNKYSCKTLNSWLVSQLASWNAVMVPVLVELCREQRGMAHFNCAAKLYGFPRGDMGENKILSIH